MATAFSDRSDAVSAGGREGGWDRRRGVPIAVAARVIAETVSILIFALVLIFGVALTPRGAMALETAAPRVLVYDATTGTTLIARGADQRIAPANFAKLMTAAVVYDALVKGQVRGDTLYKVSEHAWRSGGAPARVTTMFAAVRSEVAVDDLLTGLAVDYANDAAIILAEGLAGSETAFAARMNALAGEIGLSDSHFANPTGYVDPTAHTTLYDLVRLAAYLAKTDPVRFGNYGLDAFEWNRIRQRNKTRQVHAIAGVDGLVLAFDADDGFAGMLSARRGARQVFAVVSGLKSDDDRDKELGGLVNGAFDGYARYEIYPAGAVVGRVRVFGGAAPDVPVIGSGGDPLVVTLPVVDRASLRLSVDYRGPVAAPVHIGDRVAELVVREEGRVLKSMPLDAAGNVGKGDLKTRAIDGFYELAVHWWRRAFDAIASLI